MENAPEPPRFLSVGEGARRSGVAVSALHFYESRGLISSLRSRSNHRQFPRAVLRRLAVIRVAQSLGFTLADITPLLTRFPPDRPPSAADVRDMAVAWREVLQDRIDGLVRLRDNLDGCIGCGCLSKEECPLRNPADELAAKGSGAVLLHDGR